MFDFDAGKFLIIGVVALIVIGPKELPRVLRQLGQTISKVRRMAAEFQGQFMDAMKEADIESIRQDLKKIGDDADSQLNIHFDPARDIQRELTATLEEPAAAAAVPAMAEVADAATDHFALPSPAAESDDEGAAVSPAGAGIAPAPTATDGLAVSPDGLDAIALNGEAMADAQNGRLNGGSRPARKRKIIVAKRRDLDAARTHSVCDRTQPAARGAVRR